ncbi:MAG: PAS domain S-box protein [Bacteroidales bacterium]|nr:PAS domain S-box protein [Bacteroidales bacterium]
MNSGNNWCNLTKDSILDSIPDMIIIMHRDGTVLEIHGAKPDKLMAPANELIGYNIKDSFDKDELKRHLDLYKRCIKNRETGEIEYKLNINNCDLYFESKVKALDNERVLTIVRDITNWKMLEIDREIALKKADDIGQRFEQIAEHVGEFIWEVDSKGVYTYVNRAAISILGYTQEEIVGKMSCFDLMPEDERLKLTDIVYKVFARKETIYNLENSAITKDGRRVYVITNGIPILDREGELFGYRGSSRDITEQLKFYQDLLISKQKAEESSRLKTAFINNISHEIRTPLNGILGFVEIIMEDNDLKRSRGEELSTLHMSSKRLQKTVDDIMTISELTSGTITPNIESFDLCLLICELFERTTLLCSKKGILSCTDFPSGCEELMLRSDPDLLKNALWQLLENAVKFTRQGCITVGFTHDNDMVTLFVKDTGSGISNEMLNDIFDPFMQEDVSSTRGYEGSGLGLPIAKGITEVLGGQVRVETEKNIGSKFYLSLPLLSEKMIPEVSLLKEESIDSSSGKLILIAEDDDYNYLYINTILQKAGYCTLHAINGVEAVMMCRQNDDISMVFMDIKMPVMNGLEAIKQVKEMRPHLPLIATTAYVQAGDKQRFISAGCNDYLAKPIKVSEILAMVNKYMSHTSSIE